MRIPARNILIGVVCIVVADLLLAWLRSAGDLPLPNWLEAAIATAIAVVVWFALVARFGDKPTRNVQTPPRA